MNRARRQKVKELKQGGLSPKQCYEQSKKWWKALPKEEKVKLRVVGLNGIS